MPELSHQSQTFFDSVFNELISMEADEAEATVEAAFNFAGYPSPTFLAPMADARWWASLAHRNELKAYALAAYDAMPSHDQAAFLRHIKAFGSAT